MIQIAINGGPYINFISASSNTVLNTLCNDFSFTTSAVKGTPVFRIDDMVEIYVDGVKVLTGFIDEINGSEQPGSHVVTYSGRDKTSVIVDSNIDVLSPLRAGANLTLKKVAEAVVRHLKADLSVISDYSPLPFKKAEDIITARVGVNAFDFLSQWARKRQALLTSNGDGDMVITQSKETDSGATLQAVRGGHGNNILSQSWSISSGELYNRYVHKGQLNAGTLGSLGNLGGVQAQAGVAIDDTVRAGRQKVVVEQQAYSSVQLKDRAKWSKQLAAAKATAFNCTVKGHSTGTGGIWTPNTLVLINSESADISRKMLLNSCSFNEGEGQPTTTSLEFVEQNVYTLDQRLLSEKKSGKQNELFKSLG